MADFTQRIAAATIILLVAQLSPARAEEAFGIKGAVPGMKLSEFRAVPYPATRLQRKIDPDAQYELNCTGDKDRRTEGYKWIGSPKMDYLPAVITCSHIEISPPMLDRAPTPKYRGNLSYAPVGFAGLRASWTDYSAIQEVTYRFAPGKSDDPRLMLIEVKFLANKFQHLKDALTRKLGEPRTTEHEQVQNRMGARFRNDIIAWRAGGSTVSLQHYTDTLKYGRLEVFHRGLRASWLAEIQRLRDAAPDDF